MLPNFVRDCCEPLVNLIIANEAVEDVEAPLDGNVDHRTLVVWDRGLVGEGEEVHEQEHQKVQRLFIHFLNIKTFNCKVLRKRKGYENYKKKLRAKSSLY